MTIELGTFVRLKPTDYSKSLGINRRARGGEAKVIGVHEDSVGTVYTVELDRNGRTRAVRRENLVIHRKKPEKGNSRGRRPK